MSRVAYYYVLYTSKEIVDYRSELAGRRQTRRALKAHHDATPDSRLSSEFTYYSFLHSSVLIYPVEIVSLHSTRALVEGCLVSVTVGNLIGYHV